MTHMKCTHIYICHDYEIIETVKHCKNCLPNETYNKPHMYIDFKCQCSECKSKMTSGTWVLGSTEKDIIEYMKLTNLKYDFIS
uniref:Uncharacterized protein n=1 Tax=viral metagenome TaxID=1070528 RepID=A0A6M3IJX3_9ZZZZ